MSPKIGMENAFTEQLEDPSDIATGTGWAGWGWDSGSGDRRQLEPGRDRSLSADRDAPVQFPEVQASFRKALRV